MIWRGWHGNPRQEKLEYLLKHYGLYSKTSQNISRFLAFSATFPQICWKYLECFGVFWYVWNSLEYLETCTRNVAVVHAWAGRTCYLLNRFPRAADDELSRLGGERKVESSCPCVPCSLAWLYSVALGHLTPIRVSSRMRTCSARRLSYALRATDIYENKARPRHLLDSGRQRACLDLTF